MRGCDRSAQYRAPDGRGYSRGDEPGASGLNGACGRRSVLDSGGFASLNPPSEAPGRVLVLMVAARATSTTAPTSAPKTTQVLRLRIGWLLLGDSASLDFTARIPCGAPRGPEARVGRARGHPSEYGS